AKAGEPVAQPADKRAGGNDEGRTPIHWIVLGRMSEMPAARQGAAPGAGRAALALIAVLGAGVKTRPRRTARRSPAATAAAAAGKAVEKSSIARPAARAPVVARPAAAIGLFRERHPCQCGGMRARYRALARNTGFLVLLAASLALGLAPANAQVAV